MSLQFDWRQLRELDLHLRPTQETDLAYVLDAEARPENAPFVTQWSLERHQKSLLEPDVAHLIVERIGDQTKVGYVILLGLTNPHEAVEFRRLVITEKGSGYGRAAVKLIKHYAFARLKAHRLWLDVK
ncbi:MAG: GNAT family N-acetyltransferase, partial [Chitinophagaceae bacterium]|nr:GNAT family N-acetyltransferase [Anaerolineae bacterium]